MGTSVQELQPMLITSKSDDLQTTLPRNIVVFNQEQHHLILSTLNTTNNCSDEQKGACEVSLLTVQIAMFCVQSCQSYHPVKKSGSSALARMAEWARALAE